MDIKWKMSFQSFSLYIFFYYYFLQLENRKVYTQLRFYRNYEYVHILYMYATHITCIRRACHPHDNINFILFFFGARCLMKIMQNVVYICYGVYKILSKVKERERGRATLLNWIYVVWKYVKYFHFINKSNKITTTEYTKFQVSISLIRIYLAIWLYVNLVGLI